LTSLGRAAIKPMTLPARYICSESKTMIPMPQHVSFGDIS